MNLFVAGVDLYAARAYERLRRLPGVTIAGVATTPDPTDAFTTLMEYAGPAANVPLRSLRLPATTVPLFRYLGVDLLVLANMPHILPPAVIDAPTHGALCFHPSLLPRHRGKDAVRQTIAAGDLETGVTIFRPDAGADTGDVVVQERCMVPPGVSAGRLYYGTLVPLGVEALANAVTQVRDGTARYSPQTSGVATP